MDGTLGGERTYHCLFGKGSMGYAGLADGKLFADESVRTCPNRFALPMSGALTVRIYEISFLLILSCSAIKNEM